MSCCSLRIDRVADEESARAFRALVCAAETGEAVYGARFVSDRKSEA
jgi:hypothetical protein